MPVQTHNTQPALDLVSSEYLEWNNCRVLHEISYDLSVEDLDSAVVGGVGEEGEAALVETYCADGFLVEAEGLVGFVGEVEVVPEETLEGELVNVLLGVWYVEILPCRMFLR
jgi:hypothetical protein